MDTASRRSGQRGARGPRLTQRGRATLGVLAMLPIAAAVLSIEWSGLGETTEAVVTATLAEAKALTEPDPRAVATSGAALAAVTSADAPGGDAIQAAIARAVSEGPALADVPEAPGADEVLEPTPQRDAAPEPEATPRVRPSDPSAPLLASPELVLGRVPSFPSDAIERAAASGTRLSETVEVASSGDGRGRLRVDYAFDAELLRRVNRVLARDRAPRAHVVAMEVDTGRVLAFASSDPERFPPHRAYPAASLVKVVTAAAAIDHAPRLARSTCRYVGSPWRLTRSRIDRPSKGKEASLERALATSNNQCFAQLAVHGLGAERMLESLRRFGWLEAPAPGHEAGRASVGDDAFALGKLGSGLAGSHITPLHAVQLAASLSDGQIVEPWWVERVTDRNGRSLELPTRGERRRAMSARHARELRGMLVETTKSGTARRGFRKKSGRAKLGSLRVAGKTGNLSARGGELPSGRYEWFAGVAPADDPKIAIAVVQLQSDLWWSTSSQVAADVLGEIFCRSGSCRASHASRFVGDRRFALASAR